MQIEELMTAVSGVVLTPADEAFEHARHYHSGSGEPEVIVRAETVADAAAAVRWAVARSLPVTIRGGGHSVWGSVPGGVTLDIARLADVEVDGEIVRVGGGATWGAVAGALAEHGLGISSGDTASVGVGGLTLGGGIGWMVRAWGLAADQLVGAQVVTASGDTVEVSETTHPDLFWALRGGGGNFGVVTRFDFRAHPLSSIVFATLAVTDDPRAVLRCLREVVGSAPRELTVTYMDVPAMDPSAPAGVGITAVWIGDDVDAVRAALAPLLRLEGVSETDISVARYPDILLDAPAAEPGAPLPGFVGGNTLLRELEEEVIERLVAFREANEASVLFLRSLGGAYGDVPQQSTPFPARDAAWFAMAGAFDMPGLIDDGAREIIVTAWDEIEALGAGVYGNFTTSTDSAIAAKMYPPAARSRLQEVKREWDPGNVFSRNHNVLPA